MTGPLGSAPASDDDRTALWGPLLASARADGDERTLMQSHRPPGQAARADSAAALPAARVEPSTRGGGPAPGDAGPPPWVEGFHVLEKIGQGGMGAVFRAVQGSLGREVALKVMLGGGPAEEAAFLSEARVTGLLEHANVIPVHGLTQAGGVPHLAMKLVRGTSWRDLLHGEAGRGLGLRDHVKVLVAVCQAVAFAHDRRVIHRDLKPANVMVGEHGQVFVLDWGLAAGLDREACAQHGIVHVADLDVVAGTPGYMAPELADGRGAAQDERTDVYLLGACLHEVLARRPRHGGGRLVDALLAAVRSEPAAYGPDVPRELGEIANRACARDPAARYPSAVALREALEAFLEHEQALRLVEEAARADARLAAALAEPAAAAPGQRLERERAVHRLHAEVHFACEQALRIWPGAHEARDTLRAASRRLLEHALADRDLGLAERLLDDVEDPGLRRRVDALRAERAAGEAEVSALRAAAAGLDWSAVARPLGNAFVLAGVLGACAGLVLGAAFRQPEPARLLAAAGAWGVVAAAPGGLAWATLGRIGRSGLRGALVSARMLGTWGAVALACALNGAICEAASAPRPAGLANSCLLLGVGLVAMSLQSRAWLLVPAAAFLAGGPAVAASGPHAAEAFGALWGLVLTGVGVALRRGARLAP